MVREAKLVRKIQLIANLSFLISVGLINTASSRLRLLLAGILGRIAPNSRVEVGLLVSTYEIMRERLRNSLTEIEQKNKQLRESGEQLRRSRDFLQAVIDSIDEDMLVLDRSLRIVQANQSVRLRYGTEVLGRYCYEVKHGLSHPCRPPLGGCPANEVWGTGSPTRIVWVPSTGEERDSEKYLEISISPLFDRNGKVAQIVELTRDVTGSKELEKRILEVNRHLLALNSIASTASQSRSLDVILNGALDKALELIDAEVGSILLVDDKVEAAPYRIYRGLPALSEGGIASLELAKKISESGETLVVDGISGDSIVPPAIIAEGLRVFVSVPLKSKKRVVGVLNVASRTQRPFTQQEIQLLTSLGQQLGIAVENARLYQELQVKEQMRTDLLRRIISAQEDERHRVARELHDVTSQALATLAVGVEALCALPGSCSKELQTQLDGVRSLLAATSKDVHKLIYDLRPSLLDDLGLSAALRSCAHNSLDAAGVEVHFEIDGEEKRLPPEVEIALFRIAQEAIVNISRHAHAESVYVSLEFKENKVCVQIEDDGAGFDFSQGFIPRGTGRGVGLLGMKERAELVGGNLTIDTRPRGGTRVLVEIPSSIG